MRLLRRFWWVGPVLVIAVIGGFVVWALTGPGAMPEAYAALESSADVAVTTEKWLIFRPEVEPDTGFVFYPGGRVDARAYAPLAREIAASGSMVVIVPMPLNLAVLAADSAADVMAEFPAIETWAVGGHSLGGAMAARFAYLNPDAVDGLVLWAAYPAGDNDLSQADLTVLSVYGTLDGLATLGTIRASKELLPVDAEWLAIEGGNHAQFGSYGDQSGDNPAAISRAQQQAAVVEGTVRFLRDLGG